MSKPKFNPNQPFEVVGKPKFDPSQPFEEVSKPDISELESGIRGAAQGASFGFSDELTAMLESALTDKTYEQSRDESRAAYKQAQEENPISYGAGEIGGAIGTAFIPGLGVLNAGKAATFAGRAGLAAVQGGLTGAGLSEEEDVSGIAKDTAIGAATGAAMQGIGEKVIAPAAKYVGGKISNAFSSADDMANAALKKSGKFLANVPEEYTDRYIKNPDAVNKAMSREDLAQSLMDETGAMQQLREKLSLDDAIAWNELDENTVIPKSDLLDSLATNLKNSILNEHDSLSRTSGFGSSLQKLNAIEKELDNINNAYGSHLSESDLKSIVQDIRKVAYSYEGSPKYTHQGEGLRDLANYVDLFLKGGNKDYESLMEPVADKTRLLKDLERNFINKQDPASFDKFMQKLSKWQSADPASSMKKSIQRVDQITGTSMADDISNTLAKEAFSKGDTNGSRKTLFGTVVGGGAGSLMGGPVGGVVGGMIGGAAGQVGDKYAGAVFKQVLNGKIAIDKALPVIAPKLGKFAAPITEAAKRGPKALAATHFLLMQRHPEYREVMKDEE